MSAIPSDNHIRDMLDGVPPGCFDRMFEQVVARASAHGGLQPCRRLGGHVLIALDGTEYFTSRQVHCPQCSQRRRSDGADAVAGLGARRRIFEHLRSVPAHIVFPSRSAFLRAMTGLPTPIPP